ncbi:MAG: DUF1501 domain-containing protein [Planctomycetes bacterium]|nr:DUF1501 domain-containing protein [Planctomycetota bacterium]
MLSIGPMNRRAVLRAGGLGAAGLTLAGLLRNEARADTKAARPKSVIYVVLDGGPSHLDMWDPKPDAPAEVRGPFGTIATKLPGVRFTDLMPMQAQILDRLALLRGVQSVENDHFLSEVYSGLPRGSGKRPAFGSVVSRASGGAGLMPPYVSLNRPTTDQFEFEKPYYAGSQHAPFRPFGDAVDDLAPAKSLDALADRKQLLKAFDTLRRDLDRTDAIRGLDTFQARALDIITSPKVREAFDLSKEPKKNIERYGSGKYTHQTVKTLYYPFETKPFVLARRLVEAGVRVVTLRVSQWDHHSGAEADIFHSLRHIVPPTDRAIYTLVTDLEARGLADDVLVVVLGEFGRTPKITALGPGREHWADAGCAVFFGGGLKTGQVIGETDGRGERAKSGATNFQNVVATIYHVLGIDPAATIPDFTGRPQFLLDEPKPIKELMG